MSCRELERLFVGGAAAADVAAHRASCADCDGVGRETDLAVSLTEALQPPAWSPALRAALLDVPRQTVACEGADELLARSLDGEIEAADERRLQNHLSRCAACTESAGALTSMRDLTSPAAPAWLATRLAAARPQKKASFWKSVLSGRAVVAYAYAAALLVMLLGWNPTSVARTAGFARLSESTRAVVTVARNSVGDRLGALQERTVRTLAAWKGRVGGYGRAAVSNAIAIVWRPEPKKTPNRPRLGKEGDATGGSNVYFAAARPRREPFGSRFRV